MIVVKVHRSAVLDCNMTMDAITINPPIICNGTITSPKNKAAMTPADIGSRVAVMPAFVAFICLIPYKIKSKWKNGSENTDPGYIFPSSFYLLISAIVYGSKRLKSGGLG